MAVGVSVRAICRSEERIVSLRATTTSLIGRNFHKIVLGCSGAPSPEAENELTPPLSVVNAGLVEDRAMVP